MLIRPGKGASACVPLKRRFIAAAHGKFRITEIPYQVQIEAHKKIAELIHTKRCSDFWADVRERIGRRTSSDIEPRSKNVDPEVLIGDAVS